MQQASTIARAQKGHNHSHRLQILAREVLCGEGIATRELRVFCVRQQRCMAVQECTACAHCDGFSLDPKGRRSSLICSFAEPREVPNDSRTARATSPADDTLIGEIMTSEVICVTEDVTVDELTRLFVERRISGVPVVNNDGKAVGVVSKTDLVRESHEQPNVQEYDKSLQIQSGEGYAYDLGPGFHGEKLSNVRVREIMTPVAYTLKAGTPVSQAAALMAFEGIHRVPVVCESGGEVIGMLSALDVLRWIGEHDGYLRARATEEQEAAVLG